MSRRSFAGLLAGLLAVLVLGGGLEVSPGARAAGLVPSATLVPASSLGLPGEVDSNSPAVWELVEGRPRLHVLTSSHGAPNLTAGRTLARLGMVGPVGFTTHPGHGVWMEAIVPDANGTWYGYYHNEIPADLCGRADLVLPKIGTARSTDRGQTWEDLGIVLEAPRGWHECATPNGYFVGGVGDVSVILDRSQTDLYFFFSQYSRFATAQGVGVARMAWADRDEPAGKVGIWNEGIWQLPRAVEVEGGDPSQDPDGDEANNVVLAWSYPPGTPLVVPTRPWHDRDQVNNVFWGPSVHWNTFLEQYVMLLNRAKDEKWGQEGVYVSFSPVLADPSQWSAPQRLLRGGGWYPQVIGTEIGTGTDRLAGQGARFFMSGASNHVLQFTKP